MSSMSIPWLSPFRSLRHRNYRLYFCGQVVSLTGSWVQTTAVMWLAYQLTNESKWTALVSAGQLLPTFFFGAWTGALADHFPRRLLLLTTQTALAVLALALSVLVFTAVIQPWSLLALSVVSGLVTAVDLPTRLSFVGDMVAPEDVANAVALNSISFNVARLVGPALASLLMWWGPGFCFLANSFSYAAVLAGLALMTLPKSIAAHKSGHSRSLLAGFVALQHKPSLAALIFMAGIMTLCGWPFLALLPALATHRLHLEEGGYSLMISGTGAGALAAALTVAAVTSERVRGSLIGLGVALVCSGLTGLSFADDLAVAVPCCGLIGMGMILFLATSQSVVQLSAEEASRGRILGIWAMTLSGSIPLGNLLAGWAADAWGEPAVLRLQGGTCAAAALSLLYLRAISRNHPR